MHVDESGVELIIYVPRGRKAQELCFASALPINLADWLMTHPLTNIPEPVEPELVTVLTALLSLHPSNVDHVLERHGVGQLGNTDELAITGEDDDDTVDSSEDSEDVSDEEDQSHGTTLYQDPETDGVETETGSSGYTTHAISDQISNNLNMLTLVEAGASQPSSPAPSRGVSTPAQSGTHSTTPSVRGSHAIVSYALPVSPIAPRDVFTSPVHQPRQVNRHTYSLFLDRVLEAARSATFPSCRDPGLNLLCGSNPMDMGLGAFTQMERFKYIGAAGELYVFELLSKLSPALPHWSRSNWQSTMRQYATAHLDYADMSAWAGRETSDMVYNDTDGVLTSLLIEKGYVTQSWQSARPFYYLEVKTTPGDSGTHFHMSKHQYARV